LHALRELPADLLIPPRIDLSGDSFIRAVELAKKPRKPSRLLKDLMGGKNVDER
jgi:hypothetical protein